MPTDLPPDYKPKPAPDRNPGTVPDPGGIAPTPGSASHDPGVKTPPGADVIAPVPGAPAPAGTPGLGLPTF